LPNAAHYRPQGLVLCRPKIRPELHKLPRLERPR
jgi:hypothetical protein